MEENELYKTRFLKKTLEKLRNYISKRVKEIKTTKSPVDHKYTWETEIHGTVKPRLKKEKPRAETEQR